MEDEEIDADELRAIREGLDDFGAATCCFEFGLGDRRRAKGPEPLWRLRAVALGGTRLLRQAPL